MAMNVQGHQMPVPHGVNEDNPIFQRNPPQTPAPEVPLGLHDAVTLRSESEPVAASPAPVVEQPTPVEQPVADSVDLVPDTPSAPEIPAGEATEPPVTEGLPTAEDLDVLTEDGEKAELVE
jgi:hypothetical protein